jgi:hypothetical protein
LVSAPAGSLKPTVAPVPCFWTARPRCRSMTENADQIVDAALKRLDLIDRVLEVDGHAQQIVRV